MNVLHHGDCRDILPTLEAESVHAVVTDPPYHLTAGKRGGSGDASVNLDSPHGRARITAGFMGKKWDGGDVALDPATWRAVLRVMKPGAYLLAFGGTRTYHRLACAIEDAGFEVRDMVSWVYGSGFPKGTDKAKIPEAWQGFNTALKPAFEPICLARKPMIGTLAENLQAHGCGALNIDGCRIETDQSLNGGAYSGGERRREEYSSTDTAPGAVPLSRLNRGIGEFDQPAGRWPANVTHDGSEEVLEHFPEAPGQQADISTTAPSAKTSNVYGAMKREGEASQDRRYGDEGIGFQVKPGARRLDEGSAARFFYCPKADREDRDHGVESEKRPLLWSSGEKNPGAFQSPNTDRSARNHHPTVKPTELMRWLVRLVTPPGGIVLDPFAGSGSTGRAAILERMGFIGIELEDEYVPIARARIAVVDPESFKLGHS